MKDLKNLVWQVAQEASRVEADIKATHSKAPWMAKRSASLPSLRRKRSALKGRGSPTFEEHHGAGSTLGNEIPHFDKILAHIRQACQLAAYTNAADPIGFVANCLRTAADRRDKAQHSIQKQASEDADLAAIHDAQELARRQMELKARQSLLKARRQQTVAFTDAFRKWPVEVGNRLLRRYKVYFNATRGIVMARNRSVLRLVASSMNTEDFDPRGPMQPSVHGKWANAIVSSGPNDPDVLAVLRGFLTLLGYTDELIDTHRQATRLSPRVPTSFREGSGMDWSCMSYLLKDTAFFRMLAFGWLPATLTRTRLIQALQCINGIEWRISNVNPLCKAVHGPIALKSLAYILTTAEALGAETRPMYTMWGRISAPTFESEGYFGPDYEEFPTMSLLPLQNKHALPVRDCASDVPVVEGPDTAAAGKTEMNAANDKAVKGYGKIKCVLKWSQELDSMNEIDANILAIDWNGDIRDTLYHFKTTLSCETGRLLEEWEVKELVAEGDRLRSVQRTSPPTPKPTQNAAAVSTSAPENNTGDESVGPTETLTFASLKPVLPSIPSHVLPTPEDDEATDDDARPTTAKKARAISASKRRETTERAGDAGLVTQSESLAAASIAPTAGTVSTASVAGTADTSSAVDAAVPKAGGNADQKQLPNQQQQPTQLQSTAELTVSTSHTTTWTWDEEFSDKCLRLRLGKAAKQPRLLPSKPDIVKHAEGYMVDLDNAPAEVAAYAMVLSAPVQTESLRSCKSVELEFYTEHNEWITGYPVDLESTTTTECVLGFIQRREVPRSEVSKIATVNATEVDAATATTAAAQPAVDAQPAEEASADADVDTQALNTPPAPPKDTDSLMSGIKFELKDGESKVLLRAPSQAVLKPVISFRTIGKIASRLETEHDVFTVSEFCNLQFLELYMKENDISPAQIPEEISAEEFVKVRRKLGEKGLPGSPEMLGWEIHAVCEQNAAAHVHANVAVASNFTDVLRLCQEHLRKQGLSILASKMEKGGAVTKSKMMNRHEKEKEHRSAEIETRTSLDEVAHECARSCMNPFRMQPGDIIPIADKYLSENMILGVGWDDPDPGPKSSLTPTDLDLSVFAYQGDEFYDQISFMTEMSGMLHHGDNTDGVGYMDDERISINLAQLDEGVTHLFIVLTLHHGSSFNQLKSLHARLLAPVCNDSNNRTQEKEVCRYDTSATKNIPATHNALLIGHIKLDSLGWSYHGAHMSTRGQTRQAINTMLFPHMSVTGVVKAKAKWLAHHRRISHEKALREKTARASVLTAMKSSPASQSGILWGKKKDSVGIRTKHGGVKVNLTNVGEIEVPMFYVPRGVPEKALSKPPGGPKAAATWAKEPRSPEKTRKHNGLAAVSPEYAYARERLLENVLSETPITTPGARLPKNGTDVVSIKQTTVHGHDDQPDEIDLDRENHEWVAHHYTQGELSHCEVCIQLQPIHGDMQEVVSVGGIQRVQRRTDPIADPKQNHLKVKEHCYQRAPQCKECGLRICSFCDIWCWDHTRNKVKKSAQYDHDLFEKYFPATSQPPAKEGGGKL